MGLRASILWQDFWVVETILTNKKRKWDEEDPHLVKRVAMGKAEGAVIYRGVARRDAETVPERRGELEDGGARAGSHDNHVLDGAGSRHPAHWGREELVVHASVHIA